MKVFVAGATGVIGRALIPELVARGHEVVGMTRSASKQNLVRSLGARVVVADALDADAVGQAVASAEPDVIVHELTALSGELSVRDARHLDRSPMFAVTNRLRTEGTDHLLAAGQAVGARRFVAQSFAAFRFARTGGPVLSEDDPFGPSRSGVVQPGIEAMNYLERAVTAITWGEGIVLRYGGLYGPGTAISLAPDAHMAALVRKRRSPSSGTAVASSRTSTSMTPQRRPPWPSNTVTRASTTSWTTSPRRRASGCRCWPGRSMPARRGVSRAGWDDWQPGPGRRR